ncbi:hypothetical protein [Piscirickettsia litoralis]|uniref:Lipoprotein n=1 Tax=Piscirickettsia litoralis TaxID=1891921 RepID=A0ABX3A4B8_9GAMM|nr:hypothetical protein [Piscirickettsia litoralis]ODN40964.1 hypothetical protein BGC07_18795 [Piscirickettsia litoralis]
MKKLLLVVTGLLLSCSSFSKTFKVYCEPASIGSTWESACTLKGQKNLGFDPENMLYIVARGYIGNLMVKKVNLSEQSRLPYALDVPLGVDKIIFDLETIHGPTNWYVGVNISQSQFNRCDKFVVKPMNGSERSGTPSYVLASIDGDIYCS